jgi:O-acetyl-ADP-ribose deacetylase (regulator of RNase III)
MGGVQPFVELRSFGVLPLGAARLTGPGTLPFRGIIHVAGINHAWRSTEQSVRDSVRNALVIAKNEGFRSVAFPAIGAGSSIALGNRQIALWGISEQRSLKIVAEEASRSDYLGEVMVVKFRK